MKTRDILDGMAVSIYGREFDEANAKALAACDASAKARDAYIATHGYVDLVRYTLAMQAADDALREAMCLQKRASAERLGIDAACATIDRATGNG